MRFKPMTDKEISEAGLIPPGTYTFEVADATEGFSHAGNDMITLTLYVWDNSGQRRIVKDWLVEAMALKLARFSEVVGMRDKYDAGQLNAQEFVGRGGKLSLIIEKGRMKSDGSGVYNDSNKVTMYLTDAVASAITPPSVCVAPVTPATALPFNDDVPF